MNSAPMRDIPCVLPPSLFKAAIDQGLMTDVRTGKNGVRYGIVGGLTVQELVMLGVPSPRAIQRPSRYRWAV